MFFRIGKYKLSQTEVSKMISDVESLVNYYHEKDKLEKLEKILKKIKNAEKPSEKELLLIQNLKNGVNPEVAKKINEAIKYKKEREKYDWGSDNAMLAPIKEKPINISIQNKWF